MYNANATRGSATRARPSQWALLFHLRKTLALVGAVLGDRRVHWFPKSLFLGTLGALLLALLGWDVASLVVDNIVPVIGPALGLPLDGGLDWVAFSVAAFNLLRLFPTEVVGEHYDRLFRPGHAA